MLDGPEQLVAVLEGAQPAKVSGLATFREYEMEVGRASRLEICSSMRTL